MERCICGQQVYRLCSNERCLYPAQFCDDRRCNAYKNHSRCTTIIYTEYLAMENGFQTNQKNIINKVNNIMIDIAEGLKHSLTQNVRRKYYLKLQRVIKKLRKDRRLRGKEILTGKEVKEALDEVNEVEDPKELFQNGFQDFCKAMETFKNGIIAEKQKFLEKMMEEEKQSQESLPGDEVIQNNSPNQYENDIQSLEEESSQAPAQNGVTTSPKTPKRIRNSFRPENLKPNFLTDAALNWIRQTFTQKVKNIKKVFTASARENITQNNKYSPEIIYSKCGSLKNTLVVVKYLFQPLNLIYLFAGFTPLQWGQGDKYQSDPSNLSRLYWINQKMIFPLKFQEGQANKAIYIDKSFGLAFGNDLYIKSKGKYTRAVSIGNQYSIRHLTNQQRSQLTTCQLNIQSNGRVYDYQIYQIEFEQTIN